MRQKEILTAAAVTLLATGYWIIKKDTIPGAGDDPGQAGSRATVAGEYSCLTGCTLLEHPNNGGNSFHVLHGSNKYRVQLYFVDSLKIRRHRSTNDHSSNQDNLPQFTGKEVTQCRIAAKKFTLSLLKGRHFKVYTRNHAVPGGNGIYAFVEIEDSSGSRHLLSELLVEQGLAGIQVRGAKLPDGTSISGQKDKLHTIEDSAREARLGIWGYFEQ